MSEKMVHSKRQQRRGRVATGRPLRILLVRTSNVGAAFRRPSPPCVIAPLGILYLCSALRKHLGGRVEIAVESLSTAVRSVDEIPSFVSRFACDVIGISSSLVEEAEAAAVAGAARAARADTVVVVGGPYATCSPERALRTTGADFAVVGEGEATFARLVQALLGEGDPLRVPGTASVDGRGRLRLNAAAGFLDDLDALAHPAWDAIPIDTFSSLFNFNDMPTLYRPYVPIMTSRGCPYRCSFCHNVFGRRFRARSPGNVLEEMEILHDRFGVREFHVVDDIFNLDGERMEAICRAIRRRGLKIALAFPNGLRGDLLTRGQLRLLKQAGCYAITMALESASKRILRLMRKTINLDKLAAAAREASNLGIITSCFMMFGYPGERREDLETTLRWVRESAFDFPRYCVASPFPGTGMAEHARKVGFEPGAMDARRSQYDIDNRGLADMPYEEFRALVRRGIRDIIHDPVRRRRLQSIWARWDPASHDYFGFSPTKS
jgi:anaerobic magnesium-protoporphyrin IX monomethyl ester cyclase